MESAALSTDCLSECAVIRNGFGVKQPDAGVSDPVRLPRWHFPVQTPAELDGSCHAILLFPVVQRGLWFLPSAYAISPSVYLPAIRSKTPWGDCASFAEFAPSFHSKTWCSHTKTWRWNTACSIASYSIASRWRHLATRPPIKETYVLIPCGTEYVGKRPTPEVEATKVVGFGCGMACGGCFGLINVAGTWG
jgi:hypothetical protein